MMWQNKMMKGMNGDWMMVLHLKVRLIWPTAERETNNNEPVDICFKEHRLPSRLGDHRDACLVLSERISGGIDAFLAK